jgi:hypothetical protein
LNFKIKSDLRQVAVVMSQKQHGSLEKLGIRRNGFLFSNIFPKPFLVVKS